MNTVNSSRAILSAMAVAMASAPAAAQTGRRPFAELARHTLNGAHAGFDAVLVELVVPAGAPASGAHRHPGFVLGYVLEGDLRFGIDGQPAQVVGQGRTFFEPMGALHSAGGSAAEDRAVRFLAFMVVPSGSPLSLPA